MQMKKNKMKSPCVPLSGYTALHSSNNWRSSLTSSAITAHCIREVSEILAKVRSVSLYPSALVWHFQNLMQEK